MLLSSIASPHSLDAVTMFMVIRMLGMAISPPFIPVLNARHTLSPRTLGIHANDAPTAQ